MKELYVGHCLICKQGMLEIVKEIKTGICFICCDECEAEWDNPENALENVYGSRMKYGLVTGVTFDEVKSLKWDEYVVNK